MTAEWKERLNGLLSRKFLAFIIASVALFMRLIEGWQWAAIAGVYVGVNLLQKQLKGGNDGG